MGEEFARYLMIWMAFYRSRALVMQEDGRHYKMTAVVDALPASIRGLSGMCRLGDRCVMLMQRSAMWNAA